MLFASMTFLVEGLSLETLLTLKMENSLICLVGTRSPTVSITEQQLILFLKILIRNKASRCLTTTKMFVLVLLNTSKLRNSNSLFPQKMFNTSILYAVRTNWPIIIGAMYELKR
jgi:hypothetical protein